MSADSGAGAKELASMLSKALDEVEALRAQNAVYQRYLDFMLTERRRLVAAMHSSEQLAWVAVTANQWEGLERDLRAQLTAGAAAEALSKPRLVVPGGKVTADEIPAGALQAAATASVAAASSSSGAAASEASLGKAGKAARGAAGRKARGKKASAAAEAAEPLAPEPAPSASSPGAKRPKTEPAHATSPGVAPPGHPPAPPAQAAPPPPHQAWAHPSAPSSAPAPHPPAPAPTGHPALLVAPPGASAAFAGGALQHAGMAGGASAPPPAAPSSASIPLPPSSAGPAASMGGHASLLHGAGIDVSSAHPSVQEAVRAADHMMAVSHQKRMAGDAAGAAEAEAMRQQYAASLSMYVQQAQQAMYGRQAAAATQGWTA